MTMKKIATIILLLIHCLILGQSISQPKDINEAILVLNKEYSDSLKNIIKITGNDTILELIYPWSNNVNADKTISEWTTGINSENKSELEKYYLNLGIKYIPNIETIVLISFKNYLNFNTTKHDEVIKPFQKLEAKWNHEDSIKFTTDSLRGIYIPKDLNDCFKQIDSFWNDSTKQSVQKMTESEFVGRAHHGFGTWMRNNWQLWGGSRLSKYFNSINVYHPDDMSGLILHCYHRYLTGKELNIEEQIKIYQDHWEKAKEKRKKKK